MRTKFSQFLREVSQEEGGKYYNELAQCIRSGQVSYQQVQEHMKDKDFKDFYQNMFFDMGTLS